MEDLWQEKYRPKGGINDVILPTSLSAKFQGYIDGGEIPHLIFSGPPGVGKTTTARILLRNLDCDRLILNGSDQTSIDNVREDIVNFISTVSFKPFKVVFYDEGEKLSRQAWDALKGVLEKYSKYARFIFTTNTLHKIPSAIRSRCQKFEFPKLGKEDNIVYYEKILKNEGISYTAKDLETVYKYNNGDLRSAINYLDSHTIGGKLTIEHTVYYQIAKLVAAGDVLGLKKFFAANAVEWEGLYRFFYERIDDLDKLLVIAKYMQFHTSVIDPEINFVGMVIAMLELKK